MIATDTRIIVAGEGFATLSDAMDRARLLSDRVRGAKRALLAERRALGTFLIALRPHVRHGEWEERLQAAGVHMSVAKKAIALATKLSASPLPPGAPEPKSLHEAEVQAGVRVLRAPSSSSTRIPHVSGDGGSPSGKPLGRGIGPAPGWGQAGPAIALNRPAVAFSPSPNVGHRGASVRVPTLAPRVVARGAADAPTFANQQRSQSRDVAGQLRLDGLYHAAEKAAAAITDLVTKAKSGDPDAFSRLERVLAAFQGVV